MGGSPTTYGTGTHMLAVNVPAVNMPAGHLHAMRTSAAHTSAAHAQAGQPPTDLADLVRAAAPRGTGALGASTARAVQVLVEHPLGALGLVLLAGLAGALTAWLVARAVAGVGARRPATGLGTVDRLCRRPFVLTAATICAQGVAQALGVVADGWRQLVGIAAVGAVCWLSVQVLLAGQELLFARLRTDRPSGAAPAGAPSDDVRVRRMRTQISLVRRVLAAAVVVVGVAAVLMSFPQLRTFGASLLASAGLAGILAGLAAQTTLGNMFAGLQLAFTDAVRIDDVVVVEGEWGWIEEMTLTYVVVRLWDERRLVLPTTYFSTTPFENWTRHHARLLGAVTLYVDYTTPLDLLRERTRQVVEASPRWDGRTWVLQVVDTTPTAVVLRVLASASDGPTAWDLRCEIREALVTYLREEHPDALPVTRVVARGEADPGPVPASGGTLVP